MVTHRDRSLRSWLSWPGRIAVALLIGLIRVYQCTLSPLLGNVCRFEPSCSRYMVESLRKYGFFRGLAQGPAQALPLPSLEPGWIRSAVNARTHLFARPGRLP